MQSKKNSLNKFDWKRWGLNTLTFLAPAVLIFLTAIQAGVPVKDALFSIYLWALNVAIDLTRKFIEGSKK